MRLLVSVRDEREARIAVEAGADIVDVKEPSSGALEPVPAATLAAVAAAVPAHVPLGVALGEPRDAGALAALLAPRAATLAGRAAYLKFVAPADALAECVAGVRAAVPGARAVAAAYADVLGGAAARARFVRRAAAAGADGVLLDTHDKARALPALLDDGEVAALVAAAREAGVFLALAGSLGDADLTRLAALGCDVAGVRGAACEGGRAGALSAARVAALLRSARPAPRAHAVRA